MSVLEQSPDLRNVRTVYIEKMANNLDQYLGSSISSNFHGNLQVTTDRDKADAILQGENINAQDTQHSTVRLVDRSGQRVLWSGTAGDRSVKTFDLGHGGQQKIADHLIGELLKAMTHQARRHALPVKRHRVLMRFQDRIETDA